jgi:hypothetical protein
MAKNAIKADSPGPTEREILRILIKKAKQARLITYRELSSQLHTAKLAANGPHLSSLLTSISLAESEAGRGLLSAIVVRKDSGIPGVGFFRRCTPGVKVRDFRRRWEAELAKVFNEWSDR